jgi:hypothetical protein
VLRSKYVLPVIASRGRPMPKLSQNTGKSAKAEATSSNPDYGRRAPRSLRQRATPSSSTADCRSCDYRQTSISRAQLGHPT